MSAGGQLPNQVIAALMQGNRIEAVRLLREAGGQGLKEALAAIEAHSAQTSSKTASTSGRNAIQSALEKGNVIEAIRRMRAANPGMDLRAAKQAVESLQRNATMQAGQGATEARAALAKAERTPTVVEGDRGGYAVVLLAVVAAVAALAWWFIGGE